MRAAIILALALTGCPPRPPPAPPSTPPAAGMPSCGAGLIPPSSADVCDGMFTAGGLSCVQCKGAGGCLDQVDVIYCAAGSCRTDPACRFESELTQ